mmetsp:Transcript_27610/g.60955  ORF Transcript_27610/g.60955 Transcript_27610/m.60955 type:complete len:240 (-) Transcript_27610:304-1023(-)
MRIERIRASSRRLSGGCLHAGPGLRRRADSSPVSFKLALLCGENIGKPRLAWPPHEIHGLSRSRSNLPLSFSHCATNGGPPPRCRLRFRHPPVRLRRLAPRRRGQSDQGVIAQRIHRTAEARRRQSPPGNVESALVEDRHLKQDQGDGSDLGAAGGVTELNPRASGDAQASLLLQSLGEHRRKRAAHLRTSARSSPPTSPLPTAVLPRDALGALVEDVLLPLCLLRVAEEIVLERLRCA